ncbi:MAG: Uncharacterised protein [Porticoccaceae bacterium UBA1117]|nr:MAG: Uncharacterised protein [Porticoccaceae bacterium UBA1117]
MKNIYIALITLLIPSTFFCQITPIDFEPTGNGALFSWSCFENSSNPPLLISNNPDPTGINTSSTVAEFTALQSGQPWAGCETLHGSDIGSFSIDATNYNVKIMVWKTKISDVGIKLVTAAGWSTGEVKIPNTVIHQWEEITFDFSSHIQNGQTYDQLVVFPDFITRSADDIIYFDNILFEGDACSSTAASINIESCYTYTSPSGKVWIESGIYKDTIPNLSGCDSIMTIDLTINIVETGTTLSGSTITSNALVSGYSWLDCTNNFSPIIGEVNQSFTPDNIGYFAVEVTTGVCVDTSACINIISLAFSDNQGNISLKIYPNPTDGIVTINSTYQINQVQVFNLVGEIILSLAHPNKLSTTIDISQFTEGFYFFVIKSNQTEVIQKIIKK